MFLQRHLRLRFRRSLTVLSDHKAVFGCMHATAAVVVVGGAEEEVEGDGRGGRERRSGSREKESQSPSSPLLRITLPKRTQP